MSTLKQPLRGIVPPLVTPLNGRDELDRVGLKRLIEYQIAGGVSGLFVLGTTGEAPSLSYRLRYEFVELTCQIVAGRVPVLVGVTDTSVEESLRLSKFAKSVQATAVVAAAPYYFTVGQSEVCNFMLDLADESSLPLFLYNIPSCVNLSLTFETYERLSRHQNICGLKDSSGDLPAFRKLLELRSSRPDWTFLMGYESLLAEATLAGGDGGVTGGAVIHPTLFVKSFQAAECRNRQEIDRLQIDIEKVGTLYSIAGTAAAGYLRGLKCALEVMGLCSGGLATPFRSAEEPERSKIAALVKSLGLDTVPAH